jgi:hypothetical protein
MNSFFKSLVPFCPRVHFSVVWEADEGEESGEFTEYSVAIRTIAIVNGELLVGESEFLDGIPIFDGEEPTDEDLILSGHIEELSREALEALKADMAEGLPIEREIRAALGQLPALAAKLNASTNPAETDAGMQFA